MNESYAVAIWGGKAVVINEQPAGPINDRVRVMSFESLNQWFANKPTEIVGSNGKVRTVTWAADATEALMSNGGTPHVGAR